MSDTTMTALVSLRNGTIQKSRIAMGLRLSAVERGDATMPVDHIKIIQSWYDRFGQLEKEVDNQIKSIAKDQDIVQLMTSVKGVGLMYAAQVVSMVDINRSETVSSLWRYAGYAVIDGKRERPTKGEPLHYNARLKALCYLIATSFLRSNSPYRRVYDDAKLFYQANRSDWSPSRIHLASMRKMMKMWLSHLWLTWRQLENLPIRDPYVITHLGHTHLYTPEEFGWYGSIARDAEELE